MNFRNLLSSITTLAILAGIASAQFGGTVGGITTPPITFNKPAFEQTMTRSLDGNVMGYQYVLIKKGKVVSENAGGLAQNSADGNFPMTVNTPTNIGSLAKFLSGTAMLNLMQKPQSSLQYDNGLSLDQKLERRIWTTMPNAWINGMQPGIEQISFRQLLQHRSGFDREKASNRNVLGYLKDDDGFIFSQLGTREYANINFVLNGYLYYSYTNTNLRTYFNDLQNNFGWTDDQTDAVYRNNAGKALHNLMKARIWDKMTPKISPSCDGKYALANTAAYGYDSPNDLNPGEITSQIEKFGHCTGEGGYFVSARDLANYLAHFNATDLIVDQQGRNEMFNETMNPNDRLVWTSAQASNYYGTNFNMPNIAWSDGVADDFRGVIIRLPQDYYLVILTNSPDLSSGTLRQIGMQAFRDGTEHNFN